MLSRRYRNLLVWTVAFSLVAGLSSCGQETVVGYEDTGDDGTPDDSILFTDTGNSDIYDPNGNGKLDIQYDNWDGINRYEIILLHDTTNPIQLTVGAHVPIQAKVIDYETAGPAAMYPVRFTLLGANPECGQTPPCGRFLVLEGTTDENGLVAVTFEAGDQGKVLYTAELSGQQAAPVTADIQVNELPMGELKVHFLYDGEVNIHTINVRVTQGFKSCMQFSAVAPWIDDVVRQNEVSGVASTPTFIDLPTSGNYQVCATALGPTNHLTAAGCIDAIHLLPKDEMGTTDVTLNLYVLALNPAGTYDTVNNFDFTGAIPGQAGDIINLIVDIFYDPGSVLLDLVKTLVSQYIGSWVTDLAFGLFEDALGDLISDWLLNNSPDFIQDLFVIGQDLVQIVKNLEMTSQLKISKLGSDYSIQGLQNWHGITLYWKLGCAEEGEPDYDPDCGAFPFSLIQLEDTDFPMDIVSGHFTGMIANYDHLIIDTHKIELNYGKLILFVINELLLPAVSNFNSLTDLLYSLIDCAAIADGFLGDILGAIGLDEQEVESFCDQAETFILGPIEGLIGGLSIDSRLRVHGKCRMLDENDDLVVDRLFDGEWWGHIEIGSEEGEEFEGTFEAVKASYPN